MKLLGSLLIFLSVTFFGVSAVAQYVTSGSQANGRAVFGSHAHKQEMIEHFRTERDRWRQILNKSKTPQQRQDAIRWINHYQRQLTHAQNGVILKPAQGRGGGSAPSADPRKGQATTINRQQQIAEATAQIERLLEDQKKLQQKLSEIRKVAEASMAEDNQRYSQRQSQGIQALQATGRSALDYLDSLDAQERRQAAIDLNEAAIAAEKDLIEQFSAEVAEQLSAIGADWDDLLTMAGRVPEMNDPAIIKALRDMKNFNPLNPDHYGNIGSFEEADGGIVTDRGIFIPTNEAGELLHPSQARWGRYLGDTQSSLGGTVRGPGRDVAIAEYERLLSDDPEHPLDKPAWYYPYDRLSSETGMSTGPARQRAAEEYEQIKALSTAAQQKQAPKPLAQPTGQTATTVPVANQQNPNSPTLLPPRKTQQYTEPKNQPHSEWERKQIEKRRLEEARRKNPSTLDKIEFFYEDSKEAVSEKWDRARKKIKQVEQEIIDWFPDWDENLADWWER